MNTARDRDPLIAKAIGLAGSQRKLAVAAGVKQQSICKVLNRQHRVSAEMAKAIDAATGGAVPKHELRPDLFDAPPLVASPATEMA